MRNRTLITLAAATALPLLGLPASALAQDAPTTSQPYFEHMVDQSRALGLERIGLRLDAIAALDAPIDDELAEIGEFDPDFARFGGTLTMIDETLADQLLEVLEAVEEVVEEGEDASDLVAAARDLLARAYDAVIPAETRESAAFKGAVMTDLLLGEPGVAEGFEEQVEEPAGFALGWAALQRVKALWGEVADAATEQRRADAENLIATLEAVYPEAEPPEDFTGNPEEAESPSQLLVGILEEVTRADLYPGRDLGVLAGQLAAAIAPGCDAYAAGQDEIGDEVIYAAAYQYESQLGDTLGLFDPEANERVEGLLSQLVTVGDDDDDDEAAAGDDDDAPAPASDDDDDDDDDDNAVAAGDPAEVCTALIGAFTEARGVFGG